MPGSRNVPLEGSVITPGGSGQAQGGQGPSAGRGAVPLELLAQLWLFVGTSDGEQGWQRWKEKISPWKMCPDV